MKLNPVIILTLLLICFSQLANAKEPKEFTNNFFKMVQSGKIPEAYDQLFIGSQMPAQKPQAFDALKRQTASGLPIYGNILGFELIRDEKIGESIVRLVYVLKSEMAPTIWEFYFYKPKSEWFLGNVLLNDEFKLLQSMK
jgi:hypothetical protein